MKGKDFFLTLKNQGKITNEEYDAFVESIPEFEVPDNAFKAIEERFMTVERASTHPEVVNKLRFQSLNPIDRDLKKILEVIGGVDKYEAMEIDKLMREGGAPDTYKQLAALANSLPKMFDKVKVAPNDEEAKKVIDNQKKTIAELTEKFTGAQTDYEKKVRTAEEGYKKQFSDYKLSTLLEKKAGSFTFADAYQDARPELTKAILGEIRGNHLLELATKDNNEDDIQVMELKDGVTSPKFNGNTPVTIDSLLEERFKKFTKQNGTDTQKETTTIQYRENGGQQQNQTERRVGRSTEVKI